MPSREHFNGIEDTPAGRSESIRGSAFPESGLILSPSSSLPPDLPGLSGVPYPTSPSPQDSAAPVASADE